MIPVMFAISQTTRLSKLVLSISEIALAGAQLLKKKREDLRPVILAEVGKEPTIALMTQRELEVLYSSPEFRAGQARYKDHLESRAAGPAIGRPS